MAAALLRTKQLLGRACGAKFGANNMEVRKHRLKEQRSSFWQRTKHLDREGRLLSISDHIVQQGLSMRESLSSAWSASRFDAQRAVEAKTVAKASLDAWVANARAGRTKALLQSVPALAGANFRPEPFGLCDAFTIQGHSASEIANIFGWVHNESPASNLSATLEHDKQQRHQALLQADCPPLPQEPNDGASKCQKAGHCLCSQEGQRVYAMAQAFLACLRGKFPKGSGQGASSSMRELWSSCPGSCWRATSRRSSLCKVTLSARSSCTSGSSTRSRCARSFWSSLRLTTQRRRRQAAAAAMCKP